MFDFAKIEECTTQLQWNEFLNQVDVYALTMPERAEHIEALLRKWEFTDATVFFGMLKEHVRLDAWAKKGHIARNEAVTEGRVACHFGHRAIMEEFTGSAPVSKKWCLIFEDDLLDSPTMDMQENLLAFFNEVPLDFDILHLGFLWESRQERERVSHRVYRTNMAVGRHAYMVTRRGAQTLLHATYPQRDAGDEMYKKAIHDHNMAAYQPEEPLFRQDREKFMSKILMYKRPARDFRPDEESLKKWQAEAAAAKHRHKDMTEEMKQQLTQVDPRKLQALAAKYEDKKINPKHDLREPLLLVGSLNNWVPEDAKKAHAFSITRESTGSRILGEWRYAEDKTLRIDVREGGELHLETEIIPGQIVDGTLRDQGQWHEAELVFFGGEPCGRTRVRWNKAEATMFMAFRAATEAEWGDETPVQRVSDEEEHLEVEHTLTVDLPAGKTEFQVISGRCFWEWRLFPAQGVKQMTLSVDDRTSVPLAISVDKDDMSHHGRNFTISERRGGTFTIRILLKRRSRCIWYAKPTVEDMRLQRSEAAAARAPPGTPAMPWGPPLPVLGPTLPEVPKNPWDHLVNSITPVRLVGEFVNWDLKAAGCELAAQPCKQEDEWREHRVVLRLESGGLDFQVASSQLGLQWRCYPEFCTKGLCRLKPYGEAAHVKIGAEKDGDGCCFAIREPKGSVVAISVFMQVQDQPLWKGLGKNCLAVEVSYDRMPGFTGLALGIGAAAKDNFSLAQIQPVRLVGECCKWSTRASGLEFIPQQNNRTGDWKEHRLCCRLQGDHIDFQVVSSTLGFQWRCYPKVRGVHVLPVGTKNNIEVAIGGKNDGHGCNFRVEEPAFSIITLSVWLRTREDPDRVTGGRCGEVMATYMVENTGLTVGIGPSHVQWPLKKRR